MKKSSFGRKALDMLMLKTKLTRTESTVYQLASITKTFGSIILMQQVEAGKVSLEDPIAKYGINLGGTMGKR